jgi:glutaredoxin 3
MALGLVFRPPTKDKAAVKQARHLARAAAGDLVARFTAAFSGLTCRELVGYDFSAPGGYQEFLESGVWKEKCLAYVQFAVERVYESAGAPESGTAGSVTVYTKRGCPYCEKALRDLAGRGISFVEIGIDDDPAARDIVMKLSDGKGIVPIVVDERGEVTVGFGGG